MPLVVQGPPAPPPRVWLLASFAALYAAQGVPFGLAAEYLPVMLRRSGVGMGAIAATFWLQLPWQAKVVWARVADTRAARRRARGLTLGLQLALAAAIAMHAALTLPEGLYGWLALTFACALLASSQDVFVDALAVRVLRPGERGYGNVAQVAGYRAGMLLGGGGVLLTGTWLGPSKALLLLGALVALFAGFAFVAAFADARDGDPEETPSEPPPLGALVRSLLAPPAWRVLAVAATFKLGIHVASPLVKPMVVDGGFSNHEVGLAVVTLGTAASFAGAAAGGLLHRIVRESSALGIACVVHAVATVPLIAVERAGVPFGPTAACIAVEHFASGLGTTVLFAALMSATRPSAAAFHYTLLTSLNALAIGVGGTVGGVLADQLGRPFAYAVAAALSLAPLLGLRDWEGARDASRREAP